MSFTSTASTRKQRRKQEREAKKQNKRGKQTNTNQQQPNDSAKPNSEAGKRKTPPTKPERSPGKKARRPSSSTPRHDPYAHLDPAIAAAMRKDDEEIADLEKKLGLTGNANAKDKSRLNKEYAKKECFGEDFGAFLDGLDNMVQRIMEPNAAAAAAANNNQQEDGSSSEEEDDSSTSDDDNSSDSDNVEKECAE